MKVLLYTENEKLLSKSGVGRAIKHQMKALELNHIDYTTDKLDKTTDIAHINTVGLSSVLLAKLYKKQGKKVIIHAHSTEEDYRNSFFFANCTSKLFKKWLIYAYSQADELLTPTPYSKKLLDNYGIHRKIHSISNGIDTTKFSYSHNSAIEFRKKYNFSSNDKIILSVGLQIKRKGILDFIELANKMPNYHFVWCGYTSSFLMTSDVRKAIKNAPSNVHFLGYVDNMIGAYSACNLFFMPTYEETEGIVVLEALSIKKPVLIRDIPVYTSWLENGVNCYKGKTNNDFEYMIEGIIDEQLPETTENGYIVAKNRSLDKIGKKLTYIYDQIAVNGVCYELQV